MSDSSAGSSGSGKPAKNKFQRECKAAYLMVKIDTSNDLLSVDEFIQAMQHAGRNPTRKIVKKYWPNENSGRITFQRFCDILKEQPETTDAELKKAFRKIDRNQNGYISFEELKILKHTDENLTDEELQNIFSGADKNGDGKIDYNEFVKMVQETTEETKKVALARLEKLERKQLKVKKQNRRERNKEHQISTLKSTDFITKQAVKIVKKFNEIDLQHWNKLKLKGCFIYDDEPNFPTLLSHQYKLIVKKKTEIFVNIYHHTNDPKNHSDDTLMILADEDGQIIAFTNERTKDNIYCFNCSLNEGQYILIPLTTGCKYVPKKVDTSKTRATLIENGKDGKIKLTKPLKLALMNIFDLCDLDDSGTLNRSEFNIYNIRTGDEHVTDEEWAIVSTNFDNKLKELTIKGFVDLHQMEAEDSGGDTDDMWVSLLAMGFNHALHMEQVLPFLFEIYFKNETNDVTIDYLEIQAISNEMMHELIDYFKSKSIDLNKNQKELRCFQNDFMAVILLHNQDTVNKQYQISFDGSSNVSFSDGASNLINVRAEVNETKVSKEGCTENDIKIISYAIPTDPDKEWTIKAAILKENT